MKDATHHLKHIQKKVIQENRRILAKSSLKEQSQETNPSASVEGYHTERVASNSRINSNKR